ncbi:MAG TPA: type II secretion system F family protein [Erysipelothrix sp.]
MITYYLSMDQKGKYRLVGYAQSSRLIDDAYCCDSNIVIAKFQFPFKIYPQYNDEKRLAFYQSLLQQSSYRTLHQQLVIMQSMSGQFSGCAQRLAARMELGLRFSQALLLEGYRFPLTEVKLFANAEKMATLSRALSQQCEFLENKIHYKKELKEHLRYPLILLVMTLLLSVYVFVYIFPKLQAINASFKHQSFWQSARFKIFIVMILVLGFVSFDLYRRQKTLLDKTLCRISTLYPLLLSVHTINLLSLGASQVKNHYDLFGFVVTMSHKKRIKEDFSLIQSLWQQGHSVEIISEILVGLHPELIALLKQPIRIASYRHTQKMLQEELNRALKKRCNLLEPMMIVLISIFILFVLFQVIKPMVDYYDSFI